MTPKLWVLHFSLTDEIERGAAIMACNMATASLSDVLPDEVAAQALEPPPTAR